MLVAPHKCTLQKFIYIQKRGTVALLKVCIGRRIQRVKAVDLK